MKITEIRLWEAFSAVAKHKNFSKAATELKVGVPQLSKRITKLEGDLGLRLFQRSTRAVSLTEEARALVPRVNLLLEDLRALESQLEPQEKLSGTLKITCVPFLAKRLLPAIKKFRNDHPNVQMQIDLSENLVNLIESNFDLAIRIQNPGDTELIYRRLAANQLIFCASPGYLKKSKSPVLQPKDLLNHELLALDIHRGCKFKNNTRLDKFLPAAKIQVNNGNFLTELALNDFGILLRSIWDVQEEIKKGRLKHVLANYPIENFGFIHAVIPSRRYLAPRVRAFLSLLEALPWLETADS